MQRLATAGSCQSFGEASPDHFVRRQEDPPVEASRNAARMEPGELAQLGAAVGVGNDSPLEPGITGHEHLGAQTQQ